METTIGARPIIKFIGGTIQWIGIISVLFGIANLFFDLIPKWKMVIIIIGVIIYILGMILGSTISIIYNKANKLLESKKI